jgi:hypothetical protein
MTMEKIFDNLRKQDKQKPRSILQPVSGWMPIPSRVLMAEEQWNLLLEAESEMLRPLEPYFCPKAD